MTIKGCCTPFIFFEDVVVTRKKPHFQYMYSGGMPSPPLEIIKEWKQNGIFIIVCIENKMASL